MTSSQNAPLLYRLTASASPRERGRQERFLRSSGLFTDLLATRAHENLKALLLNLAWLALGDGYAPDLASFEVHLNAACEDLKATRLQEIITAMGRSDVTSPPGALSFWNEDAYRKNPDRVLAWLLWRVHARHGLHLLDWSYADGHVIALALTHPLGNRASLTFTPLPGLKDIPAERLTRPPLDLEHARGEFQTTREEGSPVWTGRKNTAGVTVSSATDSLTITPDRPPKTGPQPELSFNHHEAHALAEALLHLSESGTLSLAREDAGRGRVMLAFSRSRQTVALYWKMQTPDGLDVGPGHASMPLGPFRDLLKQGKKPALPEPPPSAPFSVTAQATPGSPEVRDVPGVLLSWPGGSVSLSPQTAHAVVAFAMPGTLSVMLDHGPTFTALSLNENGNLQLMFWPQPAAHDAEPDSELNVRAGDRAQFARLLRAAAREATRLPDLSRPVTLLDTINLLGGSISVPRNFRNADLKKGDQGP